MDPINSSTDPPLCAKEELIAEPSKKLSELIVTPSADDHSTDVLTEETASATTSAAASTPAVKNRCECCTKKVGLMGFNCRCGKTFCRAHRYPKDHSCTFDFKTLDQQNLAKQNPLVAGDKLGSRI
ncbi:hypothetical protein OIU77_000133 [Salix suchowensis]|uniref:AN1-type domain-containing protein n=1 Tax=Salix suchowensis TaxID=1278906 RepID=A0ABQ9B7E8_9ROSI|nr:hypothetical protein OIU77_000133 [Salix suchowensis]